MPPNGYCSVMATTNGQAPKVETVVEYAARLGVHPNLVRRWIRNGWLPEAIPVTPRMYILPAGLPRPTEAETREAYLDAIRLAPEVKASRKREYNRERAKRIAEE